MIADVAVPVPNHSTYSYLIPSYLSSRLEVGQRVLVPIKTRESVGYVLSLYEKEEKGLKGIIDMIDEIPIFPSTMLPLFQWLSRYYIYPIGLVIKESIPFKEKERPSLYLSVGEDLRDTNVLNDEELNIIKTIKHRKLPIGLDLRILKGLVENGYLKIKSPYVGGPTSDSEFERPTCLNNYQETALNTICDSITSNTFKVFLLHGVTGSGKTEIYLNAIEKAIAIGKSAIIIVPEIALSIYMENFFRSVFKNSLAIYHSKITPKHKQSQWMGMLLGYYKVSLGARSAIFSPFKDLGLIIVDEEHDDSYKQENGLRYNARDVAIVRAMHSNCPVVLGSATPSIRSYFNALQGKYHLLELPERVEKRPLPTIKIIDMGSLSKEEKAKSLVSPQMKAAIEETLSSNGQVIVFHSRRGFFRMLICQLCGYVVKCPDCDIAMIHHMEDQILLCHYCGKRLPVLTFCPKCNKNTLKAYGYGTERITEIVKEVFTNATVERIDTDSAKKKDLQKIIADFKDQKIQILVGTQIITKGYDFPNVTLVCVISSDLLLDFPDYRASEKTFQLISQVAGRAGRGKDPGHVIVQSHNPWHYSIKYAMEHDYKKFYETEISLRRKLFYPPFCHIVLITAISKEKLKAFEHSKGLKALIDKTIENSPLKDKVLLYGPIPSPIGKLKGFYRFQILLKTTKIMELSDILRGMIPRKNPGVRVIIDVDPYDML